MAIKALQE